MSDVAVDFLNSRKDTLSLCSPLEIEDFVAQPFPHVSPPKWHLAHTTWFFERFILKERLPSYRMFDEDWDFLFNSYYTTVGKRWKRSDRGKLSRPTVKEIVRYRNYVDEKLVELLDSDLGALNEIKELVELGVHHEKQHQELLLMDIKSILSFGPKKYPYEAVLDEAPSNSPGGESFEEGEAWLHLPEGFSKFGADNDAFAFDNERPRHSRHLQAAMISKKLVTNGEFLEFIKDKGYERPELWLSLGWDWVIENAVASPLYWQLKEGSWKEFTLGGEVELVEHWPVQHVSFFEADAYARWKGARLPSEFEFELAFSLAESSSKRDSRLRATRTDVWENQLWCWSSNQYQAYPGYESYQGSLGEYNQKFMCNQFVLKGGSFATPEGHYRPTYRNFYEPWQRWMFSGIRLAQNA